MNGLGKLALAEAYGTFLLTLMGPGTIIAMYLLQPFGLLGPSPAQLGFIGFAHGLAVMIAAYSVGHVSGAHINPAVTIAQWATHRLEKRKVVPYLAGQFGGAIVAGLVLLILWSSSSAATNAAQSTFVGGNLPNVATFGANSYGAAFLAEIVGTAVLVFTVFGTTDKNAERPWAGLAIGFAVAGVIWTMAPISGASINPARTFGPALASSGFSLTPLGDYWIYLFGPIFGGLLGGFLHDVLK